MFTTETFWVGAYFGAIVMYGALCAFAALIARSASEDEA